MQIYILCNNLGLLIYGLLFTSVCYAGRIFGKPFFCCILTILFNCCCCSFAGRFICVRFGSFILLLVCWHIVVSIPAIYTFFYPTNHADGWVKWKRFVCVCVIRKIHVFILWTTRIATLSMYISPLNQ